MYSSCVVLNIFDISDDHKFLHIFFFKLKAHKKVKRKRFKTNNATNENPQASFHAHSQTDKTFNSISNISNISVFDRKKLCPHVNRIKNENIFIGPRSLQFISVAGNIFQVLFQLWAYSQWKIIIAVLVAQHNFKSVLEALIKPKTVTYKVILHLSHSNLDW